MITGIYKILNKVNNKVYIGSATNIKKRWRDHKWYLNHNFHHNSHLQSAWNKYGVDAFEFLIILECVVDELLIDEKECIVKYDAFNNNYGYNVNDPEHSFLNKKHTEQTKKILSLQKQGKNNPMYGKTGIKSPRFNVKASQETKDKISLNRKGIGGRIGENNPTSKLKACDIINIRKMCYEEKISQRKIAKSYNISDTTINSIINGKTWSHIK
jgi:group I intron endonuclease